ncbi:undecaprenyl-phosphate glucose phosphotransferase [Acinetobacter sp. ANC 5380]|uniref:Undecaprenyl-phosphate glucose phosphotransferase n=1 Tax=Acinetobacter terrae TaxID=2731247 RepID=A0A7Y2WAE0_9GAMM|nr:undecaprenyl-phosphate glucose phosphotransferase [Acinetobacter terrae]NNH76578.1 undecaprenyl-phosphate glucose phosphotransferase [Acinetobacter terrae]
MASRLNASYVSIFQRFCDVLAIYFSLYIVFKTNHLPIDNQTLLAFLSIVSIFQLIGGVTDFYRSWRGIGLRNELISCVKNISLTIFIFYTINIFFTHIELLVFIECFVLLIFFLGGFRVSIRLISSLFFKTFDRAKDVIVIGDCERAKKLYHDLGLSKWTGYNPVGIFSFKADYNDSEFSGNVSTVVEKIKLSGIRKIYIVINKNNINQVEALLEVLADTTCSTVIIPDLFNYNLLYSRIEDINGSPVIPLIDTRIYGINNFVKRVEDICFASVVLVIISPILMAIAIAIKLNSKGPVFFKQIRYGLNGKPILVYKFRTMSVMENGPEVKQAVKNDPRVTSVGRILRKTSLDELPQFFNVILGNMSVVGPRPHAVAHNEEYRKLITGYMLRHKVKPGITGLAQVKGWRGETDTLDKMEKRIECDLEYIRTWNLLLDAKIIFLTVLHGFINKAAY